MPNCSLFSTLKMTQLIYLQHMKCLAKVTEVYRQNSQCNLTCLVELWWHCILKDIYLLWEMLTAWKTWVAFALLSLVLETMLPKWKLQQLMIKTLSNLRLILQLQKHKNTGLQTVLVTQIMQSYLLKQL